jgi:hypothetical protein
LVWLFAVLRSIVLRMKFNLVIKGLTMYAIHFSACILLSVLLNSQQPVVEQESSNSHRVCSAEEELERSRFLVKDLLRRRRYTLFFPEFEDKIQLGKCPLGGGIEIHWMHCLQQRMAK